MAKTPKTAEEKMDTMLNAWKTLAAGKTFAGMTLADFETLVGNSKQPRARLAELADEMTREQARRDANDALFLEKAAMVVAGVVADSTEGANSALYQAMGYVRKDDKKSGLTRKKKAPAA